MLLVQLLQTARRVPHAAKPLFVGSSASPLGSQIALYNSNGRGAVGHCCCHAPGRLFSARSNRTLATHLCTKTATNGAWLVESWRHGADAIQV